MTTLVDLQKIAKFYILVIEQKGSKELLFWGENPISWGGSDYPEFHEYLSGSYKMDLEKESPEKAIDSVYQFLPLRDLPIGSMIKAVKNGEIVFEHKITLSKWHDLNKQ